MSYKRIALFEDDPVVQDIVRFSLLEFHDIAAEASDYTQAWDLAGKIACGEIQVDVVLFDAGLGPSTLDDPTPLDIYERLDTTDRNFWIIGFSHNHLREYGIQPDKDPLKHEYLFNILDSINALPAFETSLLD